MKYDRILIFSLACIVVIQAFFLFKGKETDYSYYTNEIRKHQQTIDSLTTSINERNHEILRIKSEMAHTDSVIFNADKSKLREMSSEFFARIK